MKTTLFSCFCEKQVVNCKDGKIIGYVSDMKFDTENGRIISLFAKEQGGFNLFSKTPSVEIYWDRIAKIGEDIILVDLDPFQFPRHDKGKKEKKSFF